MLTVHVRFPATGATGYAEQARRELAATGEHALCRTVDTASGSTPQELRIARLAGQRATNQEIGTMMFLSASTVGYHLGKATVRPAGHVAPQHVTDRRGSPPQPPHRRELGRGPR